MDLNCQLCGGTGVADYDNKAAQCSACNPPLEKPKRKPMKRATIRKQSAKRKTSSLTHTQIKRLVKQEIGYCDWCGAKRDTGQLEEHHIGRSRHKETANMRRCLYVCANWLKKCHDEVDALPIEEQCQVVAVAALRAVKRCKGVTN